MAIGDIKASTGRSIQQNENIISGQFGEGVAKAIGNFGNAVGDVASVTAGLQERDRKIEEFETQKRFIEYEAEQARILREFQQTAPAAAKGVTNVTQGAVNANNKDFLATVPERLQDQYSVHLEALEQKAVNSSFAFEYEQGNVKFRQDLVELVDAQASAVRSGEVDLETGLDNLLGTLSLSDLPELEQEALSLAMEQRLALASFANEVEKGQVTDLPVRKIELGEPSPDVVLSGTGPGMRGLANTIGKGESGSRYDVRNDGSASGAPITDFADHPRITTTLSNGTRTSAAGKYQIIETTWDAAATALGLPDFSPASQDKAFMWLAEQRFKKLKLPGNPTLEEVLISNDTDSLSQLHEALKPEWAVLQDMSLEEFVASFQEVGIVGAESGAPAALPGARNGAVGTPARPDVWNDPAYASLSYEQKSKLYADGVTAAKNAKTALDKQRKEEHTAVYNTTVLAASTGTLGLAEEDDLKRAGVLTNFTEVKAYRSAVETWKTRVSSNAELQEKASNPEHVFTGSENEAFNNLLGEEGKEALGAKDQAYLNTTLTPLVQRVGYIPSDSAKVLETMVATGSASQRTYALGALSAYHAQNPQILERTTGLSDSMKKEVGWYTAAKPFYSEAEIAELVKLRRDPTFMKQHQELVTEGLKQSRENVTNADMLDALDSSIRSYLPGFLGGETAVLPMTAQQQFILRKEWDMSYAEGWAMSPNKDVAEEYAVKQLLRQWSVSGVGGVNRMARNAPETYYPTINNEYSWIDYTTRRDLGLTSDAEFSLVADGQTRQEAAAFQSSGQGNNASYMIGERDAEGNYAIKLDATGLPLRIAFDPEDPELVEAQQWIVSYENYLGKVSARVAEYRSLSFSERASQSISGELEDDIIAIEESAAAMREQRMEDFASGKSFSPDFEKRLLADMEETAQELSTINVLGAQSNPKFTAMYDKLIKDIEALGGKVPNKVESE